MKGKNLQLILGGQRSGKSSYAEFLAKAWLDKSEESLTVFLATAVAFDDEMRARILRHQQDRFLYLPEMLLIEEPIWIGEQIREHSSPNTLLVVDCLTVWLTNLLMPHPLLKIEPIPNPSIVIDDLIVALGEACGPIILIGNEIGSGVIPLGSETRLYVDQLGRLNQRIAKVCNQVTLMTAGIPLSLKGGQ
jgi:adenosylcobinamide kinase/adenosylcobinamide-phosphate guanylyltransferase